MENKEAVNWLINIMADIGKAEHSDLWHYEQALTEIKDMLESVQPERKKGYWKHINEEEERAKHNGQLLGWMPWYCSECGVGVGKHQTTFCPNCGADMRGELDERID